MYLHKYKNDNKVFFHPSSGRAKPAKTITLTPEDWVGVAPGGGLAGNALGDLEKVTFGKETELPSSEEESKQKEEKKATVIPVADYVRSMTVHCEE